MNTNQFYSDRLCDVPKVHLVYSHHIAPHSRPYISNSHEAYKIFKLNWSDQIELIEEFHILLLDQAGRAIGLAEISKGGIASTIVDVRIAFATALSARASAIILAHNHPSGNLKPSKADTKLTEKFKEVGIIHDIRVNDHLILVPKEGYFSFADEALIL